MANIHVLTRDPNGAQMVLHIAVPATNNAAGVPWRTAVTRSGLGGTTVLPDGDGTGGTISAVEKASVVSGAIYEHHIRVKNPDLTGPGLDAIYAREQAEVFARLQAQLQTYGGTR